MKIETLNDLKVFLNELSDEQLQQVAGVCVVDSHFEKIESVCITTEDYFVNDDGADPVSTFEPCDEEDKLENYEILKAGHVFLLNE